MKALHTSEPAGHKRRSRPAARTALIALALAALALLPGIATQGAAAGPSCTAEQGQALIESGRYQQAITVFGCVIDAEPTEVEGYRGRWEAKVLLGRYADAMADYGRVVAYVEPVHPDAESTVLAGYAERLASDPESVTALTGATFARWAFFDYPQAIKVADRLLDVRPGNLTGTLFRGSSRVLKGVTTQLGVADLDQAIALAPASPDVRWVVADAYTYGLSDPGRALDQASLALAWGLDTPRVHAILAASYNAFGQTEQAAAHVHEHIDQVTTELVATSPLPTGDDFELDLVPGRTYAIPIPAIAGESIRLTTGSKDFWDSIAVLVAPDGTPVVGSDDDNAYFAAFDHVAEATGTYTVLVTSFESLNTGVLVVTRD